MKRVVFDIETVGADFEDLNEKQQKYLTKWAKDEEEIISAKQSTAFYPLTGFVCAIGFYSPDAKEVMGTYFLNPAKNTVNKENDLVFRSFTTEKELLENFWKLIVNFGQIITFNGRTFDVPFLYTRSAVNKVKATTDIMGYRYGPNYKHVDLADLFSFQGAMKRKFSLEFYCQVFGINNPKKDTSGIEVSKLYKEKKYEKIARYCYGDVEATFKLYEYWKEYISLI